MRRLLNDRRGSVVTIFAICAMVLALFTAIVMNQISVYTSKRNLQAAVDMAALMLMESGQESTTAARLLIEEQMGVTMNEVTVTRGSYVADATVDATGRFTPNGSPSNAIQVTAVMPGTAVMFAERLPDFTMSASARAARRTSATLAVGSRLVRLEGGLSAALLDALLGYKGKLTVMDYESLASANLDVGQFLSALNVKADVKAVTFEDVLSAPVSVGQVVEAMAATTQDGDVLVLLKGAKPAAGGQKVKLEQVIDLGAMSGLPLDALLSGKTFPVSVGELLTASAALSDGDHQVALDLASVLGETPIANASLSIGEKPQLLTILGRAGEKDEIETSQLRLDVGALGSNPLTAVKLDVTVAGAEIEVDNIKCKTDGSAEVVIKAKTEAASLGLKASLLPRIAVKLGNDESKKVTFTKDDIAAQAYKPVRSGLGLELNGLSIAQKLLFNPVDDLLEQLGLHVAEADVKVMDVTCGSVGLVH